jgi:hypothetical protein
MSAADYVISSDICMTPGAQLTVSDDVLFSSDVNADCNVRYAVDEKADKLFIFIILCSKSRASENVPMMKYTDVRIYLGL